MKLTFANVQSSYLEGYIEGLNSRYKGNYKEWPQHLLYRKPRTYGPEQKNLKKETKELFLRDDNELHIIQEWLDMFRREIKQTEPNQHCFWKAVLQQLNIPKKYTPLVFRSHVIYYIVHNVHFFEPFLRPRLKEMQQTFESYIRNIMIGNIWGDEIILGAISRMFNIKITVLSPCYSKPWNVFHKSGVPHVVLIFNGANWNSQRPPTHITATGIYDFN